MDESPNVRQFSDVFVLLLGPFCCQIISWPADCLSVETMLATDFLENLMMSFQPSQVCSVMAPPSVSHKGTHRQNEPS